MYLLDDRDQPITNGNIHNQSIWQIYLPEEIERIYQFGAVLTHTLHALGFTPKHSRKHIKDRRAADNFSSKFTVEYFYQELCPVDPLSRIEMCYDGSQDYDREVRLSLQDQVLLNIAYPPSLVYYYDPDFGNSGLFYCFNSYTIILINSTLIAKYNKLTNSYFNLWL